MHSSVESAPCFLYDWRIGFSIQVTIVDSPRNRVTEKPRTACLRNRRFKGIKETWSPQSVSTLHLDYGSGHFLQQVDVAFSRRVVLGQVLKDANSTSHHPTITS